MKLRHIACICLISILGWTCQENGPNTKIVEHEKLDRVPLKPIFAIENPELNESSGIIRSTLFDEVFWSHNDSGDEARIFAMNAKGETISDSFRNSSDGILLTSAHNTDWEDIGRFGKELLISDMGNNDNNREDLGFFRISEPNPYTDSVVSKAFYYPVAYPDQKFFPAFWNRNFDCEAIFGFKDKIYILSKNRSNDNSKLYRFDTLIEDQVNIPNLIDRFQTEGQVTAASISEDETQLAILTYQNIWLFRGFQNDDFFDHEVYFLRIDAEQCEAIDFLSNDTLIITNEQKGIYYLATEELEKLR